MAWVIQRRGAKGTSYMGCYRDPNGRQRTVGSFSTRRAAERAAVKEELKVNDGQWHDTALGKISFRDYVETSWLPSRQIEPSTLAAYQTYLHRHFYPAFGTMQMARIATLGHPGLGHPRRRRRPVCGQRAQVPHDAALGVPPSRTRPDPLASTPVRTPSCPRSSPNAAAR